MGANWKKRDRTARMLKVQILLGKHPAGITVKDIARLCAVDLRTTYRDLDALESELNVPVWQNGNKRGVIAGYSLPPIPFTIPEAMNIYLALRLMQNYSRWYDPNIASTFAKLIPVVPPMIRTQIQNSIEWAEKQPRNEKLVHIFEVLINAFVSQHRVTIWYQELADPEPQERVIETYFIEPTTPSHASYIIAYCHLKKSICALKLNRIEKIRMENETYTVPADFNAMDYFSSAWGVFVEEPVETVKLRFAPRLNRPISEALWHPSQIMESLPDGSLIMTLRVHLTVDFRSWVFSWSDGVEVLEPASLRDYIIKGDEAVLKMYAGRDGW
jgi:predicted DNA-binding transcriptional regulator YafY